MTPPFLRCCRNVLLDLPWREGLICLALLAPETALAQQDQTPEMRDLRRGVQDCATIQDGAERLACFDHLASDVNAAPDTFVVPIDPGRVQTLQRESFGFSLPHLSSLLPSLSLGGGDTQDLQALEVQISRIIDRADGGHSFITEDGATWIQIQPSRVPNVRPGDTVTIRRAAMGSFMLVPDHGQPYRVRREG